METFLKCSGKQEWWISYKKGARENPAVVLKKFWLRVLSWEFRDFFQKSYFSEHLHTATSNNLQQCFGAFVLYAFAHKQRLFSAQPQCCLTF